MIEEPLDLPKPGDVLLTWNRHGQRNNHAAHYESQGAKVIVTENGWIARPGHKTYSLLRGQHNCGDWSVGQEDRFALLGCDLQPWRMAGDDILLLPQRGIGSPEVAMPFRWTEKMAAELRRHTSRRIRVREHPGRYPQTRSLEQDLDNVHAVVTWASGAAIKALAHGVPAFYALKGWIGAAAAKLGVEEIESPFLGDRMPMFRALAWAQFSAAEIRSGWALRWALGKT